MKHRLQFSRSHLAAIICALLWFAFWLIPFRPAPSQTVRTVAPRPVAILPGIAGRTPEIRSPELFALPSRNGFNGAFPQAHISRLSSPGETHAGSLLPKSGQSEQTDDQPRYLPRRPAEPKNPDQISLQEAIPELKTDLSMPVTHPIASARTTKGITLFLSPELKKRAIEPLTLEVSGALPPSVRIDLGIRPDGTVDQVLFDTPVENNTLAGAVRKLRFKPAAARTDSWLDLRFTSGGAF